MEKPDLTSRNRGRGTDSDKETITPRYDEAFEANIKTGSAESFPNNQRAQDLYTRAAMAGRRGLKPLAADERVELAGYWKQKQQQEKTG